MSNKGGAQRLFFALWPDNPLRDRLLGVRGDIEGFRGRAVHHDDLHVTLVFLGKVEADEYGCVLEVAEGIRGAPFELLIDRVGYWKKPRILWCGASHRPDPLMQLFEDLRDGLAGCGFPPEKRAYAPHITLARKSAPVDGYRLDRPLRLRASEFVLVSSDNTVPSPRYRVLKKWPLGS